MPANDTGAQVPNHGKPTGRAEFFKTAASEIRRSGVLSFVQRRMFCEIKGCGRCLDIDRAFLVSDRLSGSSAILCQDSWDNIRGDLTAAQFNLLEVWRGLDGAELTRDGKAWTHDGEGER
jgi:hypothetical protein